MRFMRMQGAEWAELKNSGRPAELMLVSKTEANHYAAWLRVYTKRNSFNVKHYLNPEETQKLLSSDYIKTHKVLDENSLYRVKPNGKTICRAYKTAQEEGVESFKIILGKPIYR